MIFFLFSGDYWYAAFRRRNPSISERMSQTLGKQQADITIDVIEEWFGSLMLYLSTMEGAMDMVRDPRRSFNADESGFPLCPRTSKVLAPKGSKQVYHVGASGKTQITVMAGFNAMGMYLPPLLVFPGKRLRNVNQEDLPDANFKQTEKGWMTAELFYEFMVDFHAYCVDEGIPFPVIMYIDGHSSHISLATSEFCSEKEIVLYCLPPNCTHVLQPCDFALFGPLKSFWKSAVKEWQLENLGRVVEKDTFPKVFRGAWEKVTTLEIAIRGFKGTGLFPLDVKAVDRKRLLPTTSSTTRQQPDKADTSIPKPLIIPTQYMHVPQPLVVPASMNTFTTRQLHSCTITDPSTLPTQPGTATLPMPMLPMLQNYSPPTHTPSTQTPSTLPKQPGNASLPYVLIQNDSPPTHTPSTPTSSTLPTQPGNASLPDVLSTPTATLPTLIQNDSPPTHTPYTPTSSMLPSQPDVLSTPTPTLPTLPNCTPPLLQDDISPMSILLQNDISPMSTLLQNDISLTSMLFPNNISASPTCTLLQK